MARRAAHEPSVADARYVALEGDRLTRRLHYLARRHLGYDPDAFDALPWHRRRMYVDGLVWEFVRPEDQPDDDVTDATDPDDDDLSSLGVTVRKV